MTLDDKETKILLTIHKEELNIIERKKNLVALKEILKDYKEKKTIILKLILLIKEKNYTRPYKI